MRKRLRFARGGIAGLAALALMSGPAAAGGQDFSKTKVTMTMVSDGVYLITGAGGNIVALVGEAGAVLVDSQFAELHDKIVEALSSVGKGPIRYILNTNWHYDHALGNEAFHKAGAVIIGQANCAARMPSEQKHAVIDGATPAYPAAASCRSIRSTTDTTWSPSKSAAESPAGISSRLSDRKSRRTLTSTASKRPSRFRSPAG